MPGQQYLFFAHPEWNATIGEYASDVRKKFEPVNIFPIGIAPSGRYDANPSIIFEGAEKLQDVYLFMASGDSIWAVEGNTPNEAVSSPDEILYTTVFATDNKNFLHSFPRQFGVMNPYPNPFRMNVTVHYTLPYRFERNGWLTTDPYVVSINLYDARGRLVRTLVHSRQEPGFHKVVWDGKSNSGRIVGAGAYFCRIQAGTYSGIRKMMMVK
jgi:hypothetical protein